jgi:uncharacterized protein YebE (UPF0316 family)
VVLCVIRIDEAAVRFCPGPLTKIIMNIILLFIVYFFAGVVQDFLFTINLRFVAKDKVFLSVATSFLTVVVSMLALYNIVTQLDPSNGVVAIIVYCLGVATGTYFAMKLKISNK